MKWITTIIAIFITLPIWFYLLYKILEMIQATELMWFLFWVYIPFSIVVLVVKSVIDVNERNMKDN